MYLLVCITAVQAVECTDELEELLAETGGKKAINVRRMSAHYLSQDMHASVVEINPVPAVVTNSFVGVKEDKEAAEEKDAYSNNASLARLIQLELLPYEQTVLVYDKCDKDEEKETILPIMNEGESLNLKEVEKTQHFTSPPPRYSEASLVKKLEELGIGRPSTYASIIKVLQDREYVILDKKRFNPHDRGRIVSIFLEKYFNQYVEYDFTADLENQLDEISDGKLNWKEVIRKFWETFKQLCDETVGKSNREVIDVLDEALGPHFFPPNGANEKRKCPTCDNGRLGIKVGKFGGFIGCSNYPDCKYTVQFNQLNDKDGTSLSGPKEIGIYPETGEMITLRKGPYGFYMQVGEGTKEKKPKRVSIPKNFEPDEIGLNTAIQLMGLPRKLGFHPETNKTVSAGIGMYGPYILHDKKYKALEKTDNILDIELERAIELIAKPTQRGNATLKTFGEHPTEKKNITAHDGKFGPYVKCGKINASILGDQTIDSLKLEDAIRLIDERKTKMGSKKKKKKVKN